MGPGRELRAALVDMEEFFTILRTKPNIRDGAKPLPAVPPAQPAAAHGGVPAWQMPWSTTARPSVADGSSSSSNGASGSASSSGRGLMVELQDVHFGYTKERQVRRGAAKG